GFRVTHPLGTPAGSHEEARAPKLDQAHRRREHAARLPPSHLQEKVVARAEPQPHEGAERLVEHALERSRLPKRRSLRIHLALAQVVLRDLEGPRGSRRIHGLSPSTSNEIITAHRAPFFHLIGRSMKVSPRWRRGPRARRPPRPPASPCTRARPRAGFPARCARRCHGCAAAPAPRGRTV